MKRTIVWGVLAALVSCSSGIQCTDAPLEETGLLGKWEIYQRTDTVSLLPGFVQGEDLVLENDSVCDDLNGLWDYQAPNSENGGEFTVDTAAQEITFFAPTYSLQWEYIVVDYENIVFIYNDGGLEIKELWRRK